MKRYPVAVMEKRVFFLVSRAMNIVWKEQQKSKLYENYTTVNMMIKQTCIEWALKMRFIMNEKKKRKKQAEGEIKNVCAARTVKRWNIKLFICSNCDWNNKDWFSSSASRTHRRASHQVLSQVTVLLCCARAYWHRNWWLNRLKVDGVGR